MTKEETKLSKVFQFEEGIKEGRKQALEKVEEIIDKWRIQLEDVGFITIDKHFVDELKAQIKKEMKR